MSDNGRLIINGAGEMFQVVKPEAGPMKGRVCLQVTSHVGNLNTVPGGQFTLSSDLSPVEAIALAAKLADSAGYAATFQDLKQPKDFFTRPLEGGKIPPEETRALPRGSEYGALQQRIRDAAENGDPNAARYLRDSKIAPAKPPTWNRKCYADSYNPCPTPDKCATQGECNQVYTKIVPAKPGEGK